MRSAVRRGPLLALDVMSSPGSWRNRRSARIALTGTALVLALLSLHAPSALAASGADLSVAMSDWPDPDAVGQKLQYDIYVTNRGPGNASGVTVTDVLPAGLAFVSAQTSQGTCTGTKTVTCSIGTLASGSYGASIKITVRPTSAGTFKNTATVKGAQSDPVSSNNSSSATTRVNPKPSYPVTLGGCSGSATPVSPGSCTKSIYVPSPSAVTLTFSPSATFAGNFRVEVDNWDQYFSYVVTYSGVAAAGSPVRATTWLVGGYHRLSVSAGGTLTNVSTSVNVPPQQVCGRGFCLVNTPGVSKPGPTVNVPGAAAGSFSASVVATGPVE
jgi:uncharacterized repeat protein (TIGR01451 family)